MKKLTTAVEHDLDEELASTPKAGPAKKDLKAEFDRLREILYRDFTADRCREKLRVVAPREQTTLAAIENDAGRETFKTWLDEVMASTTERDTVAWFMDITMKHSGHSETSSVLAHIQALVRIAYAQDHRLPVGATEETPSATRWRCDSKTEADWSAPPWRALGMRLEDPVKSRYRYESDGKTFRVTANTDLDCDGRSATWTLTGSVENGEISATISPPPRGSY